MDDLHSEFQLHSIDTLRQSRDGRRGDDGKSHAEPKSWASPAAAREPTPYLPTGDPERRLSYEVLASDERRVAVTLSCEPVIDLRRGHQSADYVRELRRPLTRPGEQQAVHALWPAPPGKNDRELLDGLKFKRGLALLAAQGPGYGVLTTSWREATESRVAFAALNQCLRALVDPQIRLLAELTDIPAGASHAEVAEVVAFLADRRRGVIARLPPDAEALDVIVGAGLKGVSYSLTGPVLASFAASWTRVGALIGATRKVASFVLVDQARPEFADKLRDAGATHAVFTRFGGRLI
jgi:hypothetical protein